MNHRCWTDRNVPLLLRKILLDAGTTIDPSGPYTLYLPRTSGPFAQTSRALKVPDGALVGALPGCGFLTGKRAIWVRMVQAHGAEEAAALAPPTWLLDHEPDRDRLRAQFTPGLYVLKSRREHRRGLRLAQRLEDILAVQQDLVQRVLTNGLQLNGRRVQLRLYLLLTQHRGILTVRIYDDARCLYGAASGTPADVYLQTRQVHPREGLPTTLRQLIDDSRSPVDATLTSQLRALIGKVVAAARPRILATSHLDHARCFQLLGVDVILTDQGRPVFIEANKGPSLTPTSRDDERFKRTMLRQMLAATDVLAGDGSRFVPSD